MFVQAVPDLRVDVDTSSHKDEDAAAEQVSDLSAREAGIKRLRSRDEPVIGGHDRLSLDVHVTTFAPIPHCPTHSMTSVDKSRAEG
jgi:hypothetical protein